MGSGYNHILTQLQYVSTRGCETEKKKEERKNCKKKQSRYASRGETVQAITGLTCRALVRPVLLSTTQCAQPKD